MTGRVREAGTLAPLSPINVVLYRWDGSKWAWVVTPKTAADGTWAAADLDPGTYRVRFMDVSGQHREQYYNSGTSLDVTVSGGTITSGIDALLLSPVHLSGTVVETGTLTPLSNMNVALYRYDGSAFVWRATVKTAADGTWASGDLDPGTYRVRFLDPSGLHKDVYYAAGTPQQDIVLTAGASATGVDAKLYATGKVTGTVREAGTNTALSAVNVVFYRWDGAKWAWVVTPKTGADGTYSATNLEPGTYRVRFMDTTNNHYEQYYNLGVTTDLTVTGGIVTTGIDALLQAK